MLIKNYDKLGLPVENSSILFRAIDLIKTINDSEGQSETTFYPSGYFQNVISGLESASSNIGDILLIKIPITINDFYKNDFKNNPIMTDFFKTLSPSEMRSISFISARHKGDTLDIERYVSREEIDGISYDKSKQVSQNRFLDKKIIKISSYSANTSKQLNPFIDVEFIAVAIPINIDRFSPVRRTTKRQTSNLLNVRGYESISSMATLALANDNLIYMDTLLDSRTSFNQIEPKISIKEIFPLMPKKINKIIRDHNFHGGTTENMFFSSYLNMIDLKDKTYILRSDLINHKGVNFTDSLPFLRSDMSFFTSKIKTKEEYIEPKEIYKKMSDTFNTNFNESLIELSLKWNSIYTRVSDKMNIDILAYQFIEKYFNLKADTDFYMKETLLKKIYNIETKDFFKINSWNAMAEQLDKIEVTLKSYDRVQEKIIKAAPRLRNAFLSSQIANGFTQHIIIIDSDKKTTWQAPTREYLKNFFKSDSQKLKPIRFIIIKPVNALELMKLKHVIKDRFEVTMYSSFEESMHNMIKAKKKPIKKESILAQNQPPVKYTRVIPGPNNHTGAIYANIESSQKSFVDFQKSTKDFLIIPYYTSTHNFIWEDQKLRLTTSIYNEVRQLDKIMQPLFNKEVIFISVNELKRLSSNKFEIDYLEEFIKTPSNLEIIKTQLGKIPIAPMESLLKFNNTIDLFAPLINHYVIRMDTNVLNKILNLGPNLIKNSFLFLKAFGFDIDQRQRSLKNIEAYYIVPEFIQGTFISLDLINTDSDPALECLNDIEKNYSYLTHFAIPDLIGFMRSRANLFFQEYHSDGFLMDFYTKQTNFHNLKYIPEQGVSVNCENTATGRITGFFPNANLIFNQDLIHSENFKKRLHNLDSTFLDTMQEWEKYIKDI